MDRETAAPGTEITDGGAPVTDEQEGVFVEDVLDDEVESGEEEGAGEEAGSPQRPADESAPAEGQQPGQPRDASGKFAPAADPAAGPGAQAPAGAAAQPPQTTEKPFTFRGDEQDYQITGSRLEADGSVRIPKERVEDLRRLLGEGIAHRGSYPKREAEWQRRVTEAERKSAFEVERSKAILDHFEMLVEKGPEAIGKFLEDLHLNWPRMKLEAAQQAIEKERETYRQAHAEETRSTERRDLEQALDVHIGQVKREFPDVDERIIREKLAGDLNAVFFRADRDMPEHGLKKGETGVFLGRIRQEFQHAARIVQQTRQAHTTAAATAAANRSATAGSQAPPAVAAGRGTAPSGRKKGEMPRFKTKEDRDKYLAGGYQADVDD